MNGRMLVSPMLLTMDLSLHIMLNVLGVPYNF